MWRCITSSCYLCFKKPLTTKRKLVQKKKEITREVYGWILTGSLGNWQTALEHNTWGTHSAHIESWNKLSEGDLLFFYVTKPISGIVGVGVTKSKNVGKKPLWPDEKAIEQVKYPYRWNFKVLHILDFEKWKKDSISLREINIQFYSGINPIFSSILVNKIEELIMKKWSFNLHKSRN